MTEVDTRGPALGVIDASGDETVLALVRRASEAGRYLPVDATEAPSSTAEALLALAPGPRALGYGPAWRWAESVTLADGRTLSPAEARGLAGLGAAEVAAIRWRTIELPSAQRSVIGCFGDAATVSRALGQLTEERPEGLVAVELGDRVVTRFLTGGDPGSTFNLLLRAEGDSETAALAFRKAWQAIELAGGRPATLPPGAWRWGPVHPPAGETMARLRMQAEPRDIPALFEAVLSLSEVLGGAAARAQALLGQMYAYMPAGPRLDEAIGWLEARAGEAGARTVVERYPQRQT